MIFDQYRPSSFTERFLWNNPHTLTTGMSREWAPDVAVRYNEGSSTPIYGDPGYWENYTVTDYENPAWQRGIGVDTTGGQEGIEAQRPDTVDRTYGRYIPSDWNTTGPIDYEYTAGVAPSAGLEDRTVTTTPESIAAYNNRESASPFITGSAPIQTYDINLAALDDPEYYRKLRTQEAAKPYNFGTGYVSYQTERALSPSAAASGQYRANMPNQIQATNIGVPEEWRSQFSRLAQERGRDEGLSETAMTQLSKAAEVGAAKQTSDMLLKQQQYQAFKARQDKRRGIA